MNPLLWFMIAWSRPSMNGKSLLQTIAGKHYIITYFSGVNNKLCGQFFEVILAALTKRNSKETDYIC